jgi:hypothetical protein
MDMQPVFDIKPANNRIDEIYEAIHSQRTGMNRFGFRCGYLGISVFCYLYGLHTRQQTYFRQSSKYFDLACNTINIDPLVSYRLDFSDLGIVSQYLISAGVLDLTPNIFLEDVDKFLAGKMRLEMKQNKMAGFSTGAAGYGLYFLSRANYEPQQSVVILSEFIAAIRCDELCYSGRLHRNVTDSKASHLNELSLARGISSVILLLSKVAESGWADDSNIVEIIDSISHFIFWKYERLKSSKKLLCFQDGDLGIGYALLRTGQVFNRPLCIEKGEQILEQCANICLNKKEHLSDISLLSGASGAALVFERVYKLTGNDLFNQTAEFCYSGVLEFDAEQKHTLLPSQPDLSFMEGITGTGAGMIKALSRDRIDFGELLWLI